MTIQIGVAVQRCAVEHAFQFALGRDHTIAEGGREGLKGFAIVPMHGEIDAKTLLGMIDEFLAEDGADVERRDALAVTDDRGDCEDAERIAPLFDADDRLCCRVRGHHGGATRRNIITERLGIVDSQENGGRRQDQVHQGHALRFQRLRCIAEDCRQTVAIALDDGVRNRGQGGQCRADGHRGAPLIIEGGDHAVILQLELLIERELHQRTLLHHRKGSEDGAGRCDC